MKTSKTCPKCDCKKVYVIDEASVPHYEFSNSVKPFTLVAHYGDSGERGLLGGAKKERVIVPVQAHICSECGYSELYSDTSQLAALAKAGVIG